jgi:uncharacterized RDD family membrane protein YckC
MNSEIDKRIHLYPRGEASMAYEYPSILRRYLSTFLDGVFVITVLILAGYVFQYENEPSSIARISVILFMFFVYEPFCTSLLCTLGQKLTGIRVRKLSSKEKLSIPRAYLRIFVKLFLGLISFFTIPFSKSRRAIHDFAVGSIVIYEMRPDA